MLVFMMLDDYIMMTIFNNTCIPKSIYAKLVMLDVVIRNLQRTVFSSVKIKSGFLGVNCMIH